MEGVGGQDRIEVGEFPDGLADDYQAARFVIGQRLEQNALDEREHGRGAAEAQGEGERGDESEGGGAGERARGETKVLSHPAF